MLCFSTSGWISHKPTIIRKEKAKAKAKKREVPCTCIAGGGANHRAVCTVVVDNAHGHELIGSQGTGFVEQAMTHLARKGHTKWLRAEDTRLWRMGGK